jgi:hypothetical protein
MPTSASRLDPHGGHLTSVLLVPDGVARVRLGALIPQRSVEGLSRETQRAALKTPPQSVTVQNNIAAFTRPVPTIINDPSATTTGRVAVTISSPMTWYSASGKVIRQTPEDTVAFLIVHRT